MKGLDKLRSMHEVLEESGIEGSARDAELILTHSLGIGRADLYRDNPDIDESAGAEIDRLVQRRVQREPLQYILGYTEFCGLKIMVGPGVLIPRPETEILAEKAKEVMRGKDWGHSSQKPLAFLDLCTGSGCLAIALARAFPTVEVYGTDISEKALEYARGNAELNGVKNVTFLLGDLFVPVRNMLFDMIVSNPPYIRTADIGSLQPEISDWEPVEALDGGAEGMDYYERITSGAIEQLKSRGPLMMEIGEGQSDAVRRLCEVAGFVHVSLIKDYAGIDRIVIAGKE